MARTPRSNMHFSLRATATTVQAHDEKEKDRLAELDRLGFVDHANLAAAAPPLSRSPDRQFLPGSPRYVLYPSAQVALEKMTV